MGISPGERRNAFKKHKFYAPTEREDEDTLLFTNTVLAFKKTNSVSASMFSNYEVGVTTTAVLGGFACQGGAGGLHGTGHGQSEGVRDVGGGNSAKNFYDCDENVYLI